MRVYHRLLWLAVISIAPSANALAGYCEFMLYSEYLGYSLKACQTVSEPSECGTWVSSGRSTRTMAVVEGKDRGLLRLQEGSCPLERAVGICELPAGPLVFYEGRLEFLQTGCSWMQGRWQEIERDTRDQRDARNTPSDWASVNP